MPRVVSTLDRKLLRDLWEMKGQALAIAAVVAAGVTMFVTYLSNFDSLQQTRAEDHDSARFADVFASLKRAPNSLRSQIEAIPGVERVMTRVVADVTLDVPGMAEPATGRLVALPELGRPELNDLFLRKGRWVDPNRADEVLASEMFCEAHGFGPGDRVAALINGRRRWLTVVGVALSPEYVYAIRPGDLFPDKRRFGIFWMNGTALAPAFDMDGGFNDVSIKLARGASSADVIAQVDRVLEPYGGLGAIPQNQQLSGWTLENELTQLQMFGFITPLIFLGVAAFILNVALTRALALQRSQIAALKALGFDNRSIAWHYIKWGLVIAAIGALLGVVGGAWLGSGMIGLYNQYFRFPILYYRMSTDVAVASLFGALVVAALGAWSAVRRAVRIPPAEAMRPEAPALYHHSLFETTIRLPMASRMVLRNLERSPLRTMVSVVGIAFAVAVLFVGLSFIDVMDRLINQQFILSMRQDATVSFAQPRSSRVSYDVRHMPGAMNVEPTRTVPVRLRSKGRTRTLAITGLPEHPALNRIVTRDGEVLSLPSDGLVLSKKLGEILDLAPGDLVQMSVLEGRRPVLDVPVRLLVDDSIGLQAYMRQDALHRLLGEGDTVSGAAVTVDPEQMPRFYAAIKTMPAVAGVALREMTIRNFRETMAETMNMQIFFNVLFAGVIAFGVVYNSARVSLSERSHELASLRVLGFTRAEISLILLGELAALTLLALPVGAAIGYSLGVLIMAGFNNEMYRLSFTVSSATMAWSFLVVIAAATLSGFIVRRRLDGLDLVAVLKRRE
ncbi:MAG: FtsX-like permease family protein [Vicinamibacterales bacterium]